MIPSRGDALAAMRAGANGEARGLETVLETPSGRSIAPGADGGRGDAVRRFRIDEFGAEELGLPVGARQESLRVLAPEPGLHRLEIASPDGAAITVAAVELESPIVLTTLGEPALPPARRAGDDPRPPRRRRSADRRRHPLRAARAAGGVAGEPVTLFDDGQHADGAAGDGHYAAQAGDLAGFPAGPVAVRVEAEGFDARGSAFARTGASGLVNERPGARLVPGSVRAEWTGEGEARALRVTATAAVRDGGEYRLDVLAGGAASPDGSRPGLAWAERTEDLAAGPTELTVDLPAALLGDGPLHLDVRLLGLSRLGVAGRVTLDVMP